MTIRYRYVKPPHYICAEKLPNDIHHVLRGAMSKCPTALIACENGTLIGFLRFELDDKYFWAQGTWVRPECRTAGVAAAMWRKVLAYTKPNRVTVCTISKGGRRLIGNVIREASRGITWHVEV